MSRALAHSLSTAQQYYQAPTLSDTFETYRAIDEIMRGERARSPKVEKAKEKEVKASSSDTEEQRDSYLEDDRESGEQTEEKGKGKKGKGKGKERKGEEVMARNSDRQESYMEEESAEMKGDEGRWGKKRKQQSPEPGPSSKRVTPTPKRKAFKRRRV